MEALARCEADEAGSQPAASRQTPRPGLARSVAMNVVGLGALWFAYSGVRRITADSWGVARSNARWLVGFEDSLGLPSEAVFQSIFLDYEWLVRSANFFYFGAHFPSMFVFLAWALVRQREHMPQIRWALIGSTAAGLAIQLAFPLAPPRLLDFSGFVDTARVLGPDPYALGIASAANELAAMPSMHVGWALLIALAVVQFATSPYRWLVLAHPITTMVVVVVTANHYWTDIFAGATLAGMAWWMASRKFASSSAPQPPLQGETSRDAEIVLV